MAVPYQSKYHIGLNGTGYIVAQKDGIRQYQKKRSPYFVNKFGGGDVSYRDANFWQYFVQTNWRNGAKQLKFDDPGKFWKSSDVDTTILEELSLSKAFVSAGQLAANVKVNVIDSWRASSSSAFGDGSDGALTISADTTEAPIDSACTGTSGSTSLSATNASFAANQVILIHQSRGTGAGAWEKNTISAYVAGTITTGTALANTYTTGAQVRVLKQYSAVTINSTKTYTAKAWDGSVGGILSFICSGALTVTGTISANGTGYRGGAAAIGLNAQNGFQGEGTAGAGSQSTGAANGNGGGAGQGNTGAGGSGGAAGGNGAAGTGSGSTNGAAAGNATLTTMVFGGAGGGGSSGNSGAAGAGGNGGGIVLVYGKTTTITGAITANGNAGANATPSQSGGGGGGAGGSILIKGQTVVLGTTLVTATAGSGGTGGDSASGTGGTGRIHSDYSSSISGTTNPTLDSATDSTLVDTPASTTSTVYAGGDDGKIYSWDNATTWTEVFDTRQLEWFDTGTDENYIIGDTGGTETAAAQSFQITQAMKVKGVRLYLKKNAGTPGDITVRIETNNAGVPSGTLANAAATGTIPAFTSTTQAWKTAEFSSNFTLSASTTYWIVAKTAAAANDNNYQAAGKTTSGYASGNQAASTDGGSTWSANAGKDMYFRLLGNTTSVNCSLVTKIGGTKKLYFGTGNPSGTDNMDARLISFDGTTWAVNKIFTTATESVIQTLTEFITDTKVYAGIGPQAKVYSTSDMSTWAVAKDIDVPQNPGYIYAAKEYNGALYEAGGSPELIPTGYYNGFMFYYDQTTWRSLYPFDFTVIKSMEFYDAFLFIGTYHGHIYVYDTSSLNPLFNFKDQYSFQVQTYAMKYFDDKLYIGLYPQDGTGDTNVGIWLFDRRGLALAHSVSGVTGYRCFTVANGSLLVGTGDNGYVYKLSTTQYATQGWYQSSYFDANLPSIDKLYNSVTIRHDPLATGQSIVVYYKFKESDSWTTLGTSNTVGDITKTLSFASGVFSKKISLKVELNTTTTTASPKLTEVVMQYAIYPVRKWQWTIRVKAKTNQVLLDGSIDTRTATTIRTSLEDLLTTQQLYTFVDVDGTSYTVLVNDIDNSDWVINQTNSGVNEDEVILNLLEA